jgi:hypothetical protein
VGTFNLVSLEAGGVGVEQAAAEPAQMQQRCVVRVDSPDMRVDQHLVIEPVDRVVERGLVDVDLDSRHAEQRPIVHLRQPTARLDTVAEPFFVASGADSLTLGITERDSDHAPGGGLRPQ